MEYYNNMKFKVIVFGLTVKDILSFSIFLLITHKASYGFVFKDAVAFFLPLLIADAITFSASYVIILKLGQIFGGIIRPYIIFCIDNLFTNNCYLWA